MGDCRDVLPDFPSESIDLIYLDPPFFSNRNYEVIWEDGAEKRAFEDRWKGGIRKYIQWMNVRLRYMKNLLKETGSLYLHCDWHASHYLKTILDDIFGRDNFRNEIIWKYGLGGGSNRYYRRKHDTIFFYTKSGEWIFNPPKVDATSNKMEGKKKVMPDVWTDIPSLNNMSNERLGYPTQKPKELLKRIIKASSDENDSVLDPFCGCGTTIAAAEELNRNWIGIDVSPTACSVMRKRMRDKYGKNPKIAGIPNTPKDLKTIQHFEFQNWAVRAFDGKIKGNKSSDMGVDGYTNSGNPIQVKQSENIGRNVIDNFETAVRRENSKKGIIVGFSFTSGAWEEEARVKEEEDIDIELKTVKDLIEERSEDDIPSMFIKDNRGKNNTTDITDFKS